MKRPRAALFPVVLAGSVLAACVLTGCAGVSGSPGQAADSGSITIVAAASLKGPLDTIITDYRTAHPGVQVRVSYGSSATLVSQVNAGAPADLLISAGESAALQLDPTLVHGRTRLIASNTLEIATPPSNPGQVTTLWDLGKPSLKVVLCASTAPCGRAADELCAAADFTPHVVSRELDVKATLSKVMLGEADAAIVYHSDVVSAKGKVNGVPIPARLNQVLSYPAVALTNGEPTAGFVAYLRSPEAQKVLQDSGFSAP